MTVQQHSTISWQYSLMEPMRDVSVTSIWTRPWLRVLGEKQHALILFITCCLLLVCRDPPFHFPPQRREHGMKTRRRHRSTSKSPSPFLSTVLCQLPQMSLHLAAALRHIYVQLEVGWCLCWAWAKENHCVLLMKTSSFTSSPPRPPWTPSSSALQSQHNKNCRVQCSLNGTMLVPLHSESSLSQAFFPSPQTSSYSGRQHSFGLWHKNKLKSKE